MENHKQPVNGHHASAARKQANLYKKIILIAGGVLLVILSAWLALSLLVADRPKADRYQVVVLSTGQIYFGKLKNTTGAYLVLDDVYYSKAQELPETATEEEKAAVANNATLVKMGTEVYGPENTLRIRADQVLFWQNLADDSKVVKAIEDQK